MENNQTRKPAVHILFIVFLLLAACTAMFFTACGSNGAVKKKNTDNSKTQNISAVEYDTNGKNVQIFDFNGKDAIKLDNGNVYETSNGEADENGFCDIMVSVNGEQYIHEDVCYGIDKSYMVIVDNHPYILVNSHYDNDYQITYLFDAGRVPEFITSIDADIEDIWEDNKGKLSIGGYFKIDVAGSYHAYNTYTIDVKNDTFTVTGDVYDLCHDGKNPKSLELKSDMDVMMENNKKETLKKGTKISAVATDFSHTFYFLLDDGRQGYFEYEEVMEKDKNGYEYMVRKINGKTEDDIFKDIAYAG